MSNLIGQTFLNQFRVEAFIASGGMGAVYRVTDLKRNCPLAMKVLHADLADDPTVFKRFQREAQALQKLRHPNVVPFYGLFQEKGQTFLLEEFIEGNSLQAILRERNGLPLPVDEVMVYMKGLCASLHYAHTNNIVHCDVKPGNVMVNQQGKIFLTDFGIARFVGATTTTTLGIAGTPSYMAPEQIVGRGISHVTDIYALGVILFEMLTGQRPFRGTEPETAAGGDTPSDRIRYAHLRLPPPNPQQINPKLSPVLSQMVLYGLTKNPAERFRSTLEFFSALCQAIQTQPNQVSDETTIIGEYVPRSLPHAPVQRAPFVKSEFNKFWLIPLALALAIGVYYIPPIHGRLAPRVDLLRTRIIYFFKPPAEAVFQPSGQTQLTIETAITTARAEMLLTLTPKATSTPKQGPTLTPTVTPTPLPASVILPGVVYVDQHERWNYSGPANLSMALNFWGWAGNRDDIARVVKPGTGDINESFTEQGKVDENVMSYELIDFVNENTNMHALSRYGGDENLIKRLLAAGYPVIVEKGYYEHDYTGKIDWLGHYLYTTGYDDARGGFIVQDAYLEPGKDLLSDYATYQDGWRSFNYIFMVVYPPEREAEVIDLLGPWKDETWASQHALEIAEKESKSLTGNDLFFALFNKGTSHVALQQYVDAATAYDQAFAAYEKWDIKEKNRPFRMMWYQTGPYFAYFYTARYQDVISLAETTLNNTTSSILEEALLWRGRAYYQIGDTESAVADFRAALRVHVNWTPAVQALQDLGLQP